MKKAVKRSSKAKNKHKKIHHPTPHRRRGLWNGFISFGLVNVPIYLESATEEKQIHFNLIDKHDHSPIGYKQYNKVTGKEITKNDIVKGFEYEKGRYVLMSEADFKKANPKASNSIEIEDFVELNKINPMLFEKPYYVLPQKGGEKAYVLLREVLERTEKAAIAKVVLHTKQHLVCIIPQDDYLILEILRFANEIIETQEADFLGDSVKKARVTEREISTAVQLVKGMTSIWKPEKYSDTFRDDLMKLVRSKISHHKTERIEKIKPISEKESVSNIIDLTALLKKSLEKKQRKSPAVRHGA